MMILQKIHRFKWLRVVLSIVLCFAIMFCVSSKSLEPKAVVGVDDGIFWAILAGLAEMGIRVVVTDPSVREAVSDFFWSQADQVRNDIEVIAGFVQFGYSVYYDAAVDSWSRIAHAIEDYFTTDRFPPSSILYGDVSTNSGVVDFYTANSFSFSFPELSSGFSTVDFAFNNCSFTYYVNPSANFSRTISGLAPFADSSYDAPLPDHLYFAIYPQDFDIYLLGWRDSYSTSSLSGKTFFNERFSGSSWNSSYLRETFYLSASSSDGFQLPLFDSNYGFYANSNKYYITTYGNRYAFVSHQGYPDESIYNDMTFSSGFDALRWFFDQCGIDIRVSSPSSYVPGDVDTPVVIVDPVAVQNAIDSIDDLPADSTVPLVLPSTPEQYNQLVSSIPVSNLYSGDIDMPTVNGNLWKTKFPFCIPFDLINLFSGFSAEAEAPSFHVLVMPANSFGLNNEAIYWDIDFAPYNYLVQLLRFFIALSFVVWLILKTRDLIRG